MPRNVCITAVDGQTGYLIAELLLTDEKFKVDKVVGLTLHHAGARSKAIEKLGATLVHHKPGRVREMTQILKDTECDTICLIPPTHKEKFDITMELIEAAKRSGVVQNVLFMSSAGCDLAEREKQPRLREFIDLETEVLKTKGNPDVKIGHSPCVIRAGFYAENLLLYSPQAKHDGTIPLPIGDFGKFAPIALGDVALVAAHVLSGQSEHGFAAEHRGQLITLTGPMLAAGEELAQAATDALGTEMSFDSISEAEAKKVLHTQGHHDESEREYLLEYYSLVRAGKTNYISTCAFVNITGQHPQELVDFFKTYAEEFKPVDGGPKSKKRKVDGN